MELKDAVKIAEKQSEEVRGRGFHLSSALAIIDGLEEPKSWSLVYFHPERKKALTVAATENGAQIGGEGDPLVEDDYPRTVIGDMLPASEIVKAIGKELERMLLRAMKCIVTFREGMWRCAVVTTSFQIVKIELSPKDASILKSESSSLFGKAS